MSHEHQPQNSPSDKPAEGDKQPPKTSAKVAGESITDEQQAAGYEIKFHSFSSSRDHTATTGDDQPLLDLMKRVNSGARSVEQTVQAVSEFMITDASKGVVHTHRGEERLATIGDQTPAAQGDLGKASGEPAPRQSFLDGLRKIFEHANTPEEREQMQSAFSIDYMLRKAKDFIGDVQSLITGKPAAVEKLPYDPSTGSDVTTLPFRPGIDDSQPVEMIIREKLSPEETEARRLGVQFTQAVSNATSADTYDPRTGSLPADKSDRPATTSGDAARAAAIAEDSAPIQIDVQQAVRAFEATAAALGKQVGGTAADDVTARPLPFRPGIDDDRPVPMIIREKITADGLEAEHGVVKRVGSPSPDAADSGRELGVQITQAALNSLDPRTGSLPADKSDRPATTIGDAARAAAIAEDSAPVQIDVRQAARAFEATAAALGKQVGGAAADDVTARPLPFRPGIDDDHVEPLPYKPGDNDQPVEQVIRKVAVDIMDATANEVRIAVERIGAAVDHTDHTEGVAKLDETTSKSGPKVLPGNGLYDQLPPDYSQKIFNTQCSNAYAGEATLSNATIPPGSYQAGSGWSYEKIASQHLGNGFSKEQVQSYAREIAHVNGDKPPEHTPLVLPGHDGKGGMTLHGSSNVADDLVLTKHLDGSRKIEHSWTHRTSIVHPQKGGEIVEVHSGDGPSDKFVVRHTADGKTLYQKDATAKPWELNHSKEVSDAHNKLHKLSEKLIEDPLDRAKFEADMARFEDRARKRGLPDHEVRDTFKQVARLMEGYVKDGKSDGKSPAPGERLRLAKEVLGEAAEPSSISQGQFLTCQITCVEAMIYEKEPSKAAALVADVGMTGQYRSPDGTLVTLDEQSIMPQEVIYFQDNTRSFATQLFNVTAVNLVYRSSGMNEIYAQDEKTKVHHGLEQNTYAIQRINNLQDKDTGERLYTKNWLGQTELSKTSPPGLDNDQIIGAYLLVTGRHADTFKSLSNPLELSNYSPERTPCGIEIAFDEDIAGKGKLVDAIHTEADLRTKLEALAKEPGGFPIMLRVHTQNEPFYSDSGEGIKGGAGGWHAVRITGFVPPNGVQVDNQWDAKVDHESSPIPLHQLYLAMKPPEKSVVDYQRDVDANRKSGNIDTTMEFQLLRIKHAIGQLNDYDYGAAVAKQYLEAKQRWADQQKINKFDQNERNRAEKLLQDMQTAWHKASPKAAAGFSGAPNP